MPPAQPERLAGERADAAGPAPAGSALPGGPAHRGDVEGLRAVAVVLVVAFHAGVGWLPGGYVGVDVFFVVSGFLITGLLAAELRRTGGVSLPRFYARRVRRLLPLATVVLVAVAAATTVWVAPLDRGGVGADLQSAALWYSNWHFAAESTQYMADTAHSPVLHFWSLSVEEQFYVLWPLLLLAVAGRGVARRSWPVARTRLVIALATLGAVSFTASALLTTTTGGWAYFGLHTRAWELAAGGLLALATPLLTRRSWPVALPTALGVGGLAAVIASAVLLDRTTAFPGTAAAAPVAATLALLAAGTLPTRPARPTHPDRGSRVAAVPASTRWLSTPALTYTGRLSYGWYLWHWPCLVLAGLLTTTTTTATTGDLTTTADTHPATTAAATALAVAASYALAALSHTLLENPVRRSRWLSRRVPLTVAGGAALAACSVVTAHALLPAGGGAPDAVLAVARPGVRQLSAPLAAASTPSSPLSPAASPGAGTSAGTRASSTTATGPEPTRGSPFAAGVTPAASPTPGSLHRSGSPAPTSPPADVEVPPATHLAMTPEQARDDLERGRDDCFQTYDGDSAPPDCLFGDPAGQVVVALVGDSHAGAWFPALEQAARARGWKLYLYAKTGCPFADVDVVRSADGAAYPDCARWRTDVLRRLAALPRLDLTVVARSRGYSALARDSAGDPPGAGIDGLWQAAVRSTARTLGKGGGRVVLMRDTPWPPGDVPSCLSAHLEDFLSCDFPSAGHVHLDDVLTDAETAATRDLGDVAVLDPTPWLCPGKVCPAVWTDGTVVYRDGHHMTATFARTLAGRLGAALARYL